MHKVFVRDIQGRGRDIPTRGFLMSEEYPAPKLYLLAVFPHANKKESDLQNKSAGARRHPVKARNRGLKRWSRRMSRGKTVLAISWEVRRYEL